MAIMVLFVGLVLWGICDHGSPPELIEYDNEDQYDYTMKGLL